MSEMQIRRGLNLARQYTRYIGLIMPFNSKAKPLPSNLGAPHEI